VLVDNPTLLDSLTLGCPRAVSNGKELAAAGQMLNNLNFAFCHLPFEIAF
jgi:hypothetical protein